MAGLVDLYRREMSKHFHCLATWLPGAPIEIGDVGLFEGGQFRRVTSMIELGIEVQSKTGITRQDVQITSSKGAHLSMASSASVAGLTRTEVEIRFSRSGAFIFHASNLRSRDLIDPRAADLSIVDAFKRGRWEKNWRLVDSLHVAERATIIVSERDSSGITLIAENTGVSSGLSLADARMNFSVISTYGSVMRVVGGRDLHPLFSCRGIGTRFLGDTSVRAVRNASSGRAIKPFWS